MLLLLLFSLFDLNSSQEQVTTSAGGCRQMVKMMNSTDIYILRSDAKMIIGTGFCSDEGCFYKKPGKSLCGLIN